jgi:hypothetical protein
LAVNLHTDNAEVPIALPHLLALTVDEVSKADLRAIPAAKNSKIHAEMTLYAISMGISRQKCLKKRMDIACLLLS